MEKLNVAIADDNEKMLDLLGNLWTRPEMKPTEQCTPL